MPKKQKTKKKKKPRFTIGPIEIVKVRVEPGMSMADAINKAFPEEKATEEDVIVINEGDLDK